MRIAVCITTHNRPEIFRESYDNWVKFLPSGADLIVVDDGSTIPVPEATFRFPVAKGIAVAKNKCLELAGDADYYFLVDDDIYPTRSDWYLPYIESGINHLCLSFDTFSNGRPNGRVKLRETDGLAYYQEPCGVLLFFTPICLERAGGFDTRYVKWGGEHQQLSQRIYNLGLTPSPFIDIANSLDYFYSFDQHQTTKRSVDVNTRNRAWKINRELLERDKASKAYIPFRKPKGVILTTYFTGQPDPQTGKRWDVVPSALDTLADSCHRTGLQLVVLHDSFTPETQKQGVTYHQMSISGNPYYERWRCYLAYIGACPQIEAAFCVDATDVEVLKNPFDNIAEGVLYVGDEPAKVGSPWMVRHHPSERAFIQKWSKYQLLNAGIAGGRRGVLMEFLQAMSAGGSDVTDMALLNRVVYTKFARRHSHGAHINTPFKSYTRNKVSAFRHK